MHQKEKDTKAYEAPTLRLLSLRAEYQFALSMTNGFIYDAEEQDEYWTF